MPALGQTPSPLYDISFSSKIGWGLFTGWLSKLSRKKVFKAAWSLGLKRPCYPSDAFCLKMEVTRSIQSQGWGKQTSFTDGKICSVTLQQGMSIRKGKEYLYPFFFFFFTVCNWVQNGRRQWQPTPVLLPGKPHGRRSLMGCSPWNRKESDTTERLPFPFRMGRKRRNRNRMLFTKLSCNLIFMCLG